MPTLERIHLQSFKGLTDDSIEFSPDLTTFIGPNNAGKSSVLQAIQLCRCVLELPIKDPLAEQVRAYLSEVISQGQSQAIVSYRFRLSDDEQATARDRFEKQFSAAKPGGLKSKDHQYLPKVVTASVAVRRDGREHAIAELKSMSAERADGRAVQVFSGQDTTALTESVFVMIAKSQSYSVDGSGFPENFTKTGLGSPPSGWRSNPEKLPSWLQVFVAFAENLTLIPASRHFPRQSDLREPQKPFVGPDGRCELPRMINYFASDRSPDHRKLVAAVASVFPEVQNLMGATRGQPQAELRVAERPDLVAGEAFAAWQVGSGLSHVVLCLASALIQERGSLLCIEEPELSLHPGAQRRVRDQLLKIAKDRDLQLVFATHAPSFIMTSQGSLHVCLRSPSGAAAVTKLDLARLNELGRELGVQPTDALLADAIVVVEGPTEERFYRRVLSLEGSPLAGKLHKVIGLGGTDKKIGKHLSLLEAALPTSTLKFLIIDSLPKGRELPALTGWLHAVWRGKGGEAAEFEDQFTPDEIAEALVLMGLESVSQAQVEDALKGASRRASRNLGTLYRQLCDEELNKEMLGEALASVIGRRLEQRQITWASHPALSPLTASAQQQPH